MEKKAQNNSSSSDYYSSVLAAGWVREGRNYQQLHHRRVESDHRGDGNQEVESCSCLFLGGTSVTACTAAAGEEEWAQAKSVPRDVLTQITVPGWFPRLLQQHFPPPRPPSSPVGEEEAKTIMWDKQLKCQHGLSLQHPVSCDAF